MQPEAAFKKQVDRAFDKVAKSQNWTGYRTAIEKGRGQKSGLPDRLYCVPDLGHMWIESKVGDNKPSELQCRALACLSQSGMNACWVTYYPQSETTAWCAYQEGKPFDGFVFVPLVNLKSVRFWLSMLSGNLHNAESLL